MLASLNSWAWYLHDRGKHEEAEPILREALPRLEQSEGRDNQHTVQVLVSLASSLYAQRRLDEALVLQRDAADRLMDRFLPERPVRKALIDFSSFCVSSPASPKSTASRSG